MKDKELLERIEAGDESALDFIYTKYYRMMVNMVLKNSGNEQEAKDIYQEALVIFWQKAASGKLVLTSRISTFVYSICRNLWRKELERKRRLSNEEKDGETSMDFDREERIRIMRECIENLGGSCREILQLFYFDGLSMDQIADRLNLSNADTAKTKKYKCKKQLEKYVKERYSSDDFMD